MTINMGTFDIPAADQEMFQRGGVELKKGGGVHVDIVVKMLVN